MNSNAEVLKEIIADGERERWECVTEQQVADMDRKLGALRAALADMQDAERYRVIREGKSDWHGDCYAMTFSEDGDFPLRGDKLDAAVDAQAARQEGADRGNE